MALKAPPVARLYRSVRDSFIERRAARSTFSTIYDQRGWGDEESVSGPGSNLMQTTVLRKELPQLLESIAAKSLLDAPCGDLNWMKVTNLKIERYIGADVVPELINHLQANYANGFREFRLLDITQDEMPTVDVVLCRDCLVHFSYKRIYQALNNLRRSGSTYLLTTTFENILKNTDIVTGGWRPLNLHLPPFDFPPPIRQIYEDSSDPDVKKYGKMLALWKFDSLPKV